MHHFDYFVDYFLLLDFTWRLHHDIVLYGRFEILRCSNYVQCLFEYNFVKHKLDIFECNEIVSIGHAK